MARAYVDFPRIIVSLTNSVILKPPRVKFEELAPVSVS